MKKITCDCCGADIPQPDPTKYRTVAPVMRVTVERSDYQDFDPVHTAFQTILNDICKACEEKITRAIENAVKEGK